MRIFSIITRYYQKMSIKRKINLLVILSIVLLSSMIFFIVLPIFEKSKTEDREGKLRAVVGSVVSLMEFYENEVNNEGYLKDPSLPENIEEAKKALIANVSRMRYDQNEYFFILDGSGNVVMHPLRPELVGKNMMEEKDSNGKYIFRDMVLNSQRDDETIVKYIWKSKYSETVYEPQTVYARYFWPWNWVVCSGLYTQDIIEAVRQIKIMAFIYALIATILSMIAIYRILVKTVIAPLEKLQGGIEHIQNGNYEISLPVAAEDEIGFLTKNFNIMVHKVYTAEKQLAEYANNLENKVNERTEDLKRSIDELKSTQEKLIENEKLAFLGSLVAGISHEINTPIGICVTTASHVQEEALKLKKAFEENTVTKRQFEEHLDLILQTSSLIIANTETASSLVTSFKKIAVDQSYESIIAFNLNDYLKDIFLSLKPQLKKQKNLEIDINCPDKIIINIYPSAIYQILTNLVMNSIIHGFENRETCRISLRIYDKEQYIEMIYSDNGIGMDAEVVKRMYEPFFTTKRGFGGSGLGMNIVYNIVTHKLKGSIMCESTPGNGVMFKILFPRSIEEA